MAERRLPSQAARLDPIGPDPETRQILFDDLRSPLAEREIVFGRAAFIAVPIDADDGLRPLGEPLGILLQDLPASSLSVFWL